jgi:hypothetical protein
MAMDMSSKILKNRYIIMNRQTWTNEKQYLSMVNGMEEANGPHVHFLVGGRIPCF